MKLNYKTKFWNKMMHKYKNKTTMDFGYQPISSSMNPNNPPKNGSVIIKRDSKYPLNHYIGFHAYSLEEFINTFNLIYDLIINKNLNDDKLFDIVFSEMYYTYKHYADFSLISVNNAFLAFNDVVPKDEILYKKLIKMFSILYTKQRSNCDFNVEETYKCLYSLFCGK